MFLTNFQTSAIIAGLGLAAAGFAGRYILKQMPTITQKMSEAVKNMPKLDAQVNIFCIICILIINHCHSLTSTIIFYYSLWQTVNITKEDLNQK